MFCENKEKGCKAFLTSDIQAHLKECEFNTLQCEYCQKTFLKINEKVHKQICELFPLLCDKCNKFIKRKDFEHHQQKTCPYIIQLTCNGCKQKIFLANSKEHKQNCQEMEETCYCGEVYKRREKKDHCLQNCLGKKVKKEQKKFQEEIDKLNQYVNILQRKSQGIVTFLNNLCELCDEISCQMFMKQCFYCKKQYCKSCQQKIFQNCKNCKTQFCEACCLSFMEKETCLKCQPDAFHSKIAKLKQFIQNQ